MHGPGRTGVVDAEGAKRGACTSAVDFTPKLPASQPPRRESEARRRAQHESLHNLLQFCTRRRGTRTSSRSRHRCEARAVHNRSGFAGTARRGGVHTCSGFGLPRHALRGFTRRVPLRRAGAREISCSCAREGMTGHTQFHCSCAHGCGWECVRGLARASPSRREVRRASRQQAPQAARR